MNGWAPGAKAVVVCSSHYENMGRVVVLVEFLGHNGSGQAQWQIEDIKGLPFRGYRIDALPERQLIWSNDECARGFGIEQWKLRLMVEGEATEERETGIHVLETA